MLRNLTIAAFLLLCSLARPQDIHFSQYDASLLNQSPAFTGMFDADYRLGAIYRSQWQSVPVSYNTFSMQGERRIAPLWLKRDMIGLGLLFNNDKAGDARYSTTQLYANGAYLWLLKPDTSILVSAGLNLGWGQVGFDYSRMTFDNQFDGISFNPALATGEQFHWQRRNFFDLNAGVAFKYIHKSKYRWTYALGIYHITRPLISYQGDFSSRLDNRYSNFLSLHSKIKYNLDLITEALLAFQGKNYEMIPHLGLRYYIQPDENKSIQGGLMYRSRDAVVLRLGYNQGLLQSGISYDINISRFTPATNRRGGFELFVNYLIRVKPSFLARKRLCPMFL